MSPPPIPGIGEQSLSPEINLPKRTSLNDIYPPLVFPIYFLVTFPQLIGSSSPNPLSFVELFLCHLSPFVKMAYEPLSLYIFHFLSMKFWTHKIENLNIGVPFLLLICLLFNSQTSGTKRRGKVFFLPQNHFICTM